MISNRYLNQITCWQQHFNHAYMEAGLRTGNDRLPASPLSIFQGIIYTGRPNGSRKEGITT